MSIWYAICDFLPLEMLSWTFMRNALLALLLMATRATRFRAVDGLMRERVAKGLVPDELADWPVSPLSTDRSACIRLLTMPSSRWL